MSRWSRCLLLLAAALAPGAGVRADEVTAYLEARGLTQLLAVHLEQQLEDLGPERGRAVVTRLAALYSELLEGTADPALRASLEERSRRLLTSAPEESQYLLRMALLRGAYRAAERTAEARRLRLATPEAIEAARQTLSETIPRLAELSAQIDGHWQALQRQMSRAGAAQIDALSASSEQAQRLLDQCRFVRAWALYYQAWLDRRSDAARVAQEEFGSLLDPSQPYLQPADVSIDLRGQEAVARAILGLALCKGLTASTATAVEWIELLEHERAYEPLRREVPAWKMAVFLERGEYRAAQAVLEDHRRIRTEPVPLAWLRLLAVYALEAERDRSEARQVVNLAVTEMASRGDLEQILDLASRYGAEALGDSGFALQYVKGVLAYHEARRAHAAQTPSSDPALHAAYGVALERFNAALSEPDAVRYPEAAGESRALAGWCLYFQGRPADAADVFEAAAAALTGDAAAEALWMAIVCLDRLIESGAGEAAQARLRQRMAQFLEQHPSSGHAPVLVLRQAMGEEPDDAVVADLLAIPAGSAARPSARRRAASMLYELYRRAQGEARVDYANRFVDLTREIVAEDGAALDAPGSADPLEVERHVLRCRRLAEVALADSVERVGEAREAIEAVDRLAGLGFDVSGWRDEIDYRRLRLLLLGADHRGAGHVAEELWRRAPGGAWPVLAARTMFLWAHEIRATAQPDGIDDRQALADVIQYGERVAANLGPGEEAAALTYLAAVADARFTLWERGNLEQGSLALSLYADRLLPAWPNNARVLRCTALLAEGVARRDDLALQCWRTLVAGLPMDRAEWYEAKFHHISVLARTDPALAVEVMEQHRALHPEYGPDPWGGRLRGLDQQLEPHRRGGPVAPAQEPAP
jgi:hypothetical protein